MNLPLTPLDSEKGGLMPENDRHIPKEIHGDAAIRPTSAATWAESFQRTLTAALILCVIALIAMLLPETEKRSSSFSGGGELAAVDQPDTTPRRERGIKMRVRESGRSQSAAFGL